MNASRCRTGMAFRVALAASLLGLALPGLASADPDWQVEGETGIAIVGYNDIGIDGDTGTRFSLTDELAVDPLAFIRLRLAILIDDEHFVGLLGMPLQFSAFGTLDRDTQFQDKVFAAGDYVRVNYRFNSWRLTYRYDGLQPAPGLRIGIGFTAKIRDAAVSMEGSGGRREQTDIGFVPLLSLRLDWAFSEQIGLCFELDGLAAPQGRAFDGLLALAITPVDGLTLHVGYRAIEGGADNDTVYNFTWIHVATIGATLSP